MRCSEDLKGVLISMSALAPFGHHPTEQPAQQVQLQQRT